MGRGNVPNATERNNIMNDHDLITKVLTLRGWNIMPSVDNLSTGDAEPEYWKSPDDETYWECNLPPILTSLDAVREVLPMEDTDFRYCVWLYHCGKDYQLLIGMTARDWCEAFVAWQERTG